MVSANPAPKPNKKTPRPARALSLCAKILKSAQQVSRAQADRTATAGFAGYERPSLRGDDALPKAKQIASAIKLKAISSLAS
jgi:hypothetical protein